MALDLTINKLPTLKGNIVLHSNMSGIVFLSGFAYSSIVKTIQSELKKNAKIYTGNYYFDAKSKTLELNASKINSTDYSNVVLSYKDKTEKESEESSNEIISFCTFLELTKKDSGAWTEYVEINGRILERFIVPDLTNFLENQKVEEEYKNSIYDTIFNKLYNLCPVPIKKDWIPYLVKELDKRVSIFYCKGSDIRKDKRLFAWFLKTRVNTIIEILSKGIKDGDIQVSETKEVSEEIKSVTGLDSYLNSYKEVLAEKIKDNFVPMFNPETDTYSEELNNLTDYIDYIGGLDLYDAQRGVIETTARTLKKQKNVFIIGSMGTGFRISRL